MKAERQQKERTSRVIQPSKGGGGHIVDNRFSNILQAKMVNMIQCVRNEVVRFGQLSDGEKQDLANGVRMYNNMYFKRYQEVGDYYGMVYFECPANIALLQTLFSDFFEDKFLRFNRENRDALFRFMNFRLVDMPAPAPVAVTEVIRQHSGITFTLPLDIINTIMNQYPCSFDSIKNAMDQIAAPQGGNGIRVYINTDYTSELKIQAMGDYRVFTRDMGKDRKFNIISRGLH